MKSEPSRPAPELPGVLAFLSHLWALDHGLQAASKRMLRRYGVTGLQRLVVRIVGRAPGITAGRLATVLHVHPSTLTGVLQRLCARGLLQRTADPGDRRRALFELTALGRRIDSARAGTVEAAVQKALAGLPAHKLATAIEVVAAIEAALT